MLCIDPLPPQLKWPCRAHLLVEEMIFGVYVETHAVLSFKIKQLQDHTMFLLLGRLKARESLHIEKQFCFHLCLETKMLVHSSTLATK